MNRFLSAIGVVAIGAALVVSAPASAQEADGWYGEGAFSAGTTTGNTETTDVGLGLDLNRKSGLWTYGLDAAIDYGELDGIESRNRYLLAGNLDRQINDRLFGFGRASYEVDEFTAYENRGFVGAGLGYKVLTGDVTTWSVRGGPGVKFDKFRTSALTPGQDAEQNSFGAFARSEFAHKFNENVALTNNTDVLYGENSTQLGNVIAITAAVSSNLSARASFDVRYDTEPARGFEDTDTATKVSLVYSFK
jgi:putative salt-induced outer membrane protein